MELSIGAWQDFWAEDLSRTSIDLEMRNAKAVETERENWGAK